MANKSLKNHWQKKIESWQSSGLSQKEFCRKSNISAHQFGYWRSKLSKQQVHEDQNLFLPVKSNPAFTICLGDRKISFEQAPSPVWMASFVKSYEEAYAQS